MSTPTRSRLTQRSTRSTTGIPPVTVGPNQYATCTVRNRVTSGTIEIEKSANPQSSQAFPFTGTLGDFTLVDDGTSKASRVFVDVVPGTYTVRELVPDTWSLTNVTCSGGTTAVNGAEVTITLPPGGAVVCKYTDVKVIPPSPPDPDPEPGTTLRIVKIAPRTAQIGRRLAVRIKVTNTGTVAATNVTVADAPSAAITLSRARATGNPRFRAGRAFWRIATLAPGASRTFRASALIESGTPGLKRNLAAAIADNAHVAGTATDTRLVRPAVPRVTG